MHQLEIVFPSLDYPGRSTLYPGEVGERLGVSTRHVRDLIEEGEIGSIDLSGGENKSDRKWLRIPIESYRDFILRRYTGDLADRQLHELPDATIVTLHRQLGTVLKSKGLLIR